MNRATHDLTDLPPMSPTSVMRLLPLLFILASPALADCPPEADTSDVRATLHLDLATAASEETAQAIAAELWEIWLTAPNTEAQGMLDEGISYRQIYAFMESEAALDALIAYCPDYPEAYNQRAFTRFLREDYEGSLADIDVVLAANPLHFGALTGQALCYIRQGRVELAQAAIRRAAEVHPFLEERALLPEDEDPI